MMVMVMVVMLLMMLVEGKVVTRRNEAPNLVPPNPWEQQTIQFDQAGFGLSEKKCNLFISKNSGAHQRKASIKIVCIKVIVLIWQKEERVHKK